MAKYIAQIVVLSAQIVGRAFARALQQEYSSARVAASQRGNQTSDSSAQAAKNLKMGMTLQEARDILNLDSNFDMEALEKNYTHLFSVNEKSKGGSFYLQSKVVRAKERLDEEFNFPNVDKNKKDDLS